MRRRETILARLREVANALGDELDQVVFVGGAVVALYDLPIDLRPTDDVDCTIRLTRAGYHALARRLEARGFRPSRAEGAPICRFVLGAGLQVDLMATDPAILGFSNRFFAEAVREAARYPLPGGEAVAAISPIYFLATKLEAFRDRGKGDFRASHDLEDVLAVLSGLPAVRAELERRQGQISLQVRGELERLCLDRAFVDAVRGHFEPDPAGDALAAELQEWLASLGAKGVTGG